MKRPRIEVNAFFLRGIVCALLYAAAALSQPLFEEMEGIAGSEIRSVAMGDYNNDGLPDLLMARTGQGWGQRLRLYHNEGNGLFKNRVDQVMPEGLQIRRVAGGGTIFGDYDNDGDLDVFTTVGSWSVDWAGPNTLLRNDRGVFTDVTAEAGLTEELTSDNAIWLDFDADGFLDLYVGNLGAPDIRNTLYRNNGDGTFSDATEAAGLLQQLHSEAGGSNGGMVASDFNGDGWPDLYLAVFAGPNHFFVNDGTGRFEKVESGDTADESEVYGLAVGDIDNDGDLDVFQPGGGSGSELFRSQMLLNLGGSFLDVLEAVGLTRLSAEHLLGAGMADIDNDGDVDFFTSTAFGGPFLFANNGDGTFENASDRLGYSEHGWNLALGDFDLDGFVDVLGDGRAVRARLHHNLTNDNHWIQVELAGRESNRRGIGARVSCVAGELRQMREVLGGQGYAQDNQVAHFGLGQQTLVERLEVRWPSGKTDVLENIPADLYIRVFEGRTDYQVIESPRWEVAPPESLLAESTARITSTVRPSLFEPEAGISRVTADLRKLGGGEVALQRSDDGTYVLDTSVDLLAENGWREFPLLIEQNTSLGTYWTRIFSPPILLVAATGHAIFDDDFAGEWALDRLWDCELSVKSGGSAFEGNSYMELKTNSSWKMDIKAAESVDGGGYAVLRFAFKPASDSLTRLSVLIGVKSVNVFPDGEEEMAIDAQRAEWQLVEVPLELFELTRPFDKISISARGEGIFNFDEIGLIPAKISPPSTAVLEERSELLPSSFALAQNFPNPFNGETTIRFSLPRGGEVELSIFNLAGQKVATLVEGMRSAGEYSVHWDGLNEVGRKLASGVYLYRLCAGELVETRKLLLLQ
ncbi:MAG: T9SS type A sorting domain-containing protein [Gemmatimonadetes bacterium]|jgi:enediyne biosynthesis protein E4|nr:T9SS type A sorting domain-containing protein [Gemmatimonadota bacterium]